MGNCYTCFFCFSKSKNKNDKSKFNKEDSKVNQVKEPLIFNTKKQNTSIFPELYSNPKLIGNEISIHDFRLIKTIGKGSFGKVILVQHLHLKNYFAMKILSKEELKITNEIIHTKGEREILEKISHPFLIKLQFAFQNEEKLFIVTEFMPGGDIFFHLQREEKFDEERVKIYLAEIILALEHLHKNGIIYRDLKPENILLDKEGHIKLTDFGLSKVFQNIDQNFFNSIIERKSIDKRHNYNDPSNNKGKKNNEIQNLNTHYKNKNEESYNSNTDNFYNKTNESINYSVENKKDILNSNIERAYTICGTPQYLAPEILNGDGYDKTVDWWSLGIVAFEMLNGYSPFKENKFKLNKDNYMKPFIKEKNVNEKAFDLIKKLLEVDPKKRIGSGKCDAEEIKKHKFFKGINWEKILGKKYKAQFIPQFNNYEDLINFDQMFTDENPADNNQRLNLFQNENYDNKYLDFTYINSIYFT